MAPFDFSTAYARPRWGYVLPNDPNEAVEEPSGMNDVNSIYSPSARPPSFTAASPQPDIVRDIYQPQAQNLVSKLQEAYNAPPPSAWRGFLGALISRRNPQLGAYISGQAQRQNQIQPLTNQLNLVDTLIQQNRAAQMQDLQRQNIESQIGERNDISQYRQAQAAKLGQPKIPANLTELYLQDPEKARGLVELQKEGKQEKSPRIDYANGLITDASGKTYGINDPNLPETLKPLVSAAKGAHNEAEQRQVDKESRAFGRQEKMLEERNNQLTSTTKSMVEAAPQVRNFVTKINQEIDQMKNDLGPAGSRYKEFAAGKIGLSDPAFTKLRTNIGLLTTLLMRMHVGARGGEYIMKHFQDLIDSSKQSPENLKAALQEIDSYAKDVQDEGEQHGVSSGSKKSEENSGDPLGIL